MEEQGEEFEIGLEECVVETSPDLDELPGEPPAKKTCRQKVAAKKEGEHLVKVVYAHSLPEIASSYLDKTRFKLTEHVNQSVVEFALAFEPNEVFFFVASSLKNLFYHCNCRSCRCLLQIWKSNTSEYAA